MDPSAIKEKIVRFRILIIGRANAGKTTVLQRVCNTKENPEIFDGAGKKIDAAVLTASRERGEHDINHEMVFRNNPGFIFHDSRGFEAGGESEYDKMNEFIAHRSKERKIKNRIHTIWYCIPMDQASRCFTEAERKFFSHCDTGSIPVIVIFTKFDALYASEFRRLTENGTSRKDAKQLAPKHAAETFANGPQVKFLYNSKDIQRPPKCYICLPDMDKDSADCGPLIERTAETLDNKVLEQLFVSTQQTNLELCMKYAVEKTLADLVAQNVISSSQDAVAQLGRWFPHILADDQVLFVLVDRDRREHLEDHQCADMHSRILSAASGLSPLETIVQLGSAAIIIFENSFYVFDKRRYCQDLQESVPSYIETLEQYMVSPHAPAVTEAVKTAVLTYHKAVSAAVHAYQEAVSATVPTYQGNSTPWIVKFPFQKKAKRAFERSQEEAKRAFERSQEEAKQASERSRAEAKQSACSQARAELLRTILEITLQYRLPRP